MFEASVIETSSVSRPGSPPGESSSETEKKYEINKNSQKTKMASLFIILIEFDYGSRLNIGSGFNIIYRHLKQHEFIPCILPVLRDVSRKHGTGGSVQRNLEMRRRKITQIENRSEYQVIGSKA